MCLVHFWLLLTGSYKQQCQLSKSTKVIELQFTVLFQIRDVIGHGLKHRFPIENRLDSTLHIHVQLITVAN